MTKVSCHASCLTCWAAFVIQAVVAGGGVGKGRPSFSYTGALLASTENLGSIPPFIACFSCKFNQHVLQFPLWETKRARVGASGACLTTARPSLFFPSLLFPVLLLGKFKYNYITYQWRRKLIQSRQHTVFIMLKNTDFPSLAR